MGSPPCPLGHERLAGLAPHCSGTSNNLGGWRNREATRATASALWLGMTWL